MVTAGRILAILPMILFSAQPVTWNGVPAAVQARLEQSGLSEATFDTRIARIRAESQRRVREGDLDHLVFYILQSTHFTKLPPIEPALSARDMMQGGRSGRGRYDDGLPPPVNARIAAFLKALDSTSSDPRLTYFRGLLAAESDRRRAIQSAYLRAMVFLQGKEFLAKRGAAEPALFYRTRGLSTDTAVEAGFAVHEGLSVLEALDPSRRIRRVLIVGPGMDLAPRTGMLEVGPPESYQPWAVIDSLVALGLARLDDLEVVAADVNPRVVDHLRKSAEHPPSLQLVTGLRATNGLAFTQPYRDYFTALGRSVGTVRGAPKVPEGHLAKTVRVNPQTGRVLRAETLNVVTDRLGERFDLVIATNVLVYFDDVELTLALANIAAMLTPDGVFLHNEMRAGFADAAAAAGLRGEQAREVMIASVDGAPPLADTVSIYRR